MLLLFHIFSFADEAKNVQTRAVCNKVYSGDVIIKQVRADINRLKQLKAELEPLLISDSGKLTDDISALESTFLMENEMRPKEQTNFVERKWTQVLKIRPFLAAGLDDPEKKYQIGELEDQCVNAQSR